MTLEGRLYGDDSTRLAMLAGESETCRVLVAEILEWRGLVREQIRQMATLDAQCDALSAENAALQGRALAAEQNLAEADRHLTGVLDRVQAALDAARPK